MSDPAAKFERANPLTAGVRVLSLPRYGRPVRLHMNIKMAARTVSPLVALMLLVACGGGGGGGGGSSGLPPTTAPGAPTIGTASPFDKSLSVSFTPPASNGGAAISYYTATCTAGSEVKSASGTSSPLSVSGLTNNTAYSCSVTATNSAGTSAASASVTGTPLPQPKPLSATPILGGFSAGATVDLFRADTGERIESKTTGSDGTISVSVPASYTGLAIMRVSGSGSAFYLDERTDTLKPFTANQFLLAVIPPGAMREQGVPLAVTTLTHAIALAAGINTTASAATITAPSLTDAALQSAQNRVLDALGLTTTALDPLKVPVYLKASDQGKGTKLEGSGEALNYGVVLIALAKLAPSGTELATFAQTLGTALKNGTLAADVPQIAELPQQVNSAKTGFVSSGSQSQVTVAPEPILVKTSVGPGGTLSPESVSARKGTSVKLTLSASTGYELDTISGCAGTLSGVEYTTGTLSAVCTVTAAFKLKKYTVTASAGTGGSISPTSSSIEHGSRGTFTVTASAGYAIASASGCSGSLSGSTYTTGPITGACEVTASFVRTYQITATVSGLSGSGLVLQNNGANDLSFSTNGAFVISSTAASGSAYAVTVKTQPTSPSQTCIIGNGSGTVTNANVSNITVTCTTNAYQITATVSGLSGSGLVLQNNGANDLSFSTNGAFVISSTAASGSAYAVTVKTQPTSPSQLCTVANGSGTVTNANVSNITVTCSIPGPPVFSSIPNMTINVLGVAASATSATVSATDSAGRTVTYTISSQGARGTASINSSSGVITYTISGHLSPVTATSDSFVVSASNGYSTATATVNVSLNSDPLLPNQWHLQNTGQNTFSSLPPSTGVDINITGAWNTGYSGSGVKVAVVDSGLQIEHEDLKANVDVSRSLNFITGSTDTTATGPSDHGTRVAGIIAAEGFNNKGGRGVAYGARLRGYNLLAQGAQSASNRATALGGDSVSSDNDIFNQSFGVGATSENKSLQSWNSFDGELNYNITTLRGGRGSIGVQSAGNEFLSQRGDASTCIYANDFGISCGHVATDTRRASTYPVIVGATAADGKKASYSTTGASIWISAPGGEYGRSSSYVSSTNPYAFKPAIITTTSSGCANYSISLNALDSRGANTLAAQCQYTATMNGTSSAAPVVSGVVALMLEANPNLTWRDVKHILATTAKQVDESFVPISRSGLLSSGALTLEQGWIRNSAGYYFHNWYGFGQVDAARAVAAAKEYRSYLPSRKDSLDFTLRAAQRIAIASTSSYSSTLNVTSGLSVVEGVILYVNFDTPGVYCNQIEITSPAGTKSILLNGGTGFTQSVVRDVRLASNAFYGESPVGVWRVTYHNICSASVGSTFLPAGSDQTLLFIGY